MRGTDSEPGELWADSGCVKGVAGKKNHALMQKKLATYGLKAIKVDKQDEFQFGDGEGATSDCAYVYPCVLNGNYVGQLTQAQVDVPCPSLFSKAMLKHWNCDLRFGDQVTKINRYNKEIPFRKGTPYVDIFEFGPVETFDRNKIPREHWLQDWTPPAAKPKGTVVQPSK